MLPGIYLVFSLLGISIWIHSVSLVNNNELNAGEEGSSNIL